MLRSRAAARLAASSSAPRYNSTSHPRCTRPEPAVASPPSADPAGESLGPLASSSRTAWSSWPRTAPRSATVTARAVARARSCRTPSVMSSATPACTASARSVARANARAYCSRSRASSSSMVLTWRPMRQPCSVHPAPAAAAMTTAAAAMRRVARGGNGIMVNRCSGPRPIAGMPRSWLCSVGG